MGARDMKLIFECSTRYLTSKRSEQVRFESEYEKISFISSSSHVLFYLLYKIKSIISRGKYSKIWNINLLNKYQDTCVLI